ncbi:MULTISPECIES: hypothetical protein [Ralstonia]|jgi:hypothetical protein|uniref:Integrase n=2 Tax=Ralstonia pickettii TaxID=329 RepID=A0ABM9IVJ3_RALPI|nr:MULTISPECIES: hypothetical protein [Ralstonia]CAJ0732856.1 hypothetical protein R38712_05112 [Ralstonia pickettii]HBI8622145.1 hypothetical protein [Escherichia coli]
MTTRTLRPRARAHKDSYSRTLRYEALKRAWIDSNPNASPAEYDQAMLRFARLAGV